MRWLLSFVLVLPAFSQTAADEDFHVYQESPRLLLTKQRLRLLQRERERQSMRWQQFDLLVSGGAPMPEQGLAWALYYRVAKNEKFGHQAIEWALTKASDLRQTALIFDWCGPLLTKAEAENLAAKLMLGTTTVSDDPRIQSEKTLAVIALADRLPDQGNAFLKALIVDWWRGKISPELTAGRPVIRRDQDYWIYEMMHAVRDNLRIDMRESAPAYFKILPTDHLVGHYPRPFEAAENEYRVPVYLGDGAPDLTVAVLSRATELAMVAFDNNAPESQYLQGWLMQDRFLMRGALGVVYEFLWANPYQPGLSYFQMPLVFHDGRSGHVFARSSWDEDATWIGYFEGRLQLFRDGQIETLKAGATIKPVRVGDAVLMNGKDPEWRFRADGEANFVLGLTPHTAYDVEIDDQELAEIHTDAGGTLVIGLPPEREAGTRIRKRIK